jgi:hypothetical protein
VDLERAPVLPYAVRDHEPGIGRRLHARGAGHGSYASRPVVRVEAEPCQGRDR